MCVCLRVGGCVCVYVGRDLLAGSPGWPGGCVCAPQAAQLKPHPREVCRSPGLFLFRSAFWGGCKMYTSGHRHLWAPDKGGSSGVEAEWPAVRAPGGALSGDCHSHPIAREEWEAGARVIYLW